MLILGGLATFNPGWLETAAEHHDARRRESLTEAAEETEKIHHRDAEDTEKT